VPHINDASNALVNVRIDRYRYHAQRGVMLVQAQTNCSLCACAGVITHGSGRITTSGQVAALVDTVSTLNDEFKGVDPHYQHAETFSGKGWTGPAPNKIAAAASIGARNEAQIRGITAYASRQLGVCRVLKMGDTAQGDVKRSLAEAKAYMNAMADHHFVFAVLADGHWNFAHRVGAAIQFVDYQTDHPDLGGAPTVGASFQKALGQGALDDGKDVWAVLSFQVADQFPNGPAT
jgi:hypothetical protein